MNVAQFIKVKVVGRIVNYAKNHDEDYSLKVSSTLRGRYVTFAVGAITGLEPITERTCGGRRFYWFEKSPPPADSDRADMGDDAYYRPPGKPPASTYASRCVVFMDGHKPLIVNESCAEVEKLVDSVKRGTS